MAQPRVSSTLVGARTLRLPRSKLDDRQIRRPNDVSALLPSFSAELTWVARLRIMFGGQDLRDWE